ncbi:MAG: flagellar hook-length control protein FliK [Rhodobacteraceae bacterium]|nr:flagellar hook-length control protein FliK [Paracoccaceae bacterium]
MTPPAAPARLAPANAGDMTEALAALGQTNPPPDAPLMAEMTPGERAMPEPHRPTPIILPAMTEAPRPATRAMAEALHRAPDGAVDVTLSPEELGRVRLSLTPGDGTITVSITAERGETLDLMRRHADLLGNAMRDLGYGAVTLDFGGQSTDRGAGHGPANASDDGPTTDTAPPVDHRSGPPAGPVDGGLDLRL